MISRSWEFLWSNTLHIGQRKCIVIFPLSWCWRESRFVWSNQSPRVVLTIYIYVPHPAFIHTTSDANVTISWIPLFQKCNYRIVYSSSYAIKKEDYFCSEGFFFKTTKLAILLHCWGDFAVCICWTLWNTHAFIINLFLNKLLFIYNFSIFT